MLGGVNVCICTCKNVAEDAGGRTSPHLGWVVMCPSIPYLCSLALSLQSGSPLSSLSRARWLRAPRRNRTVACCLRAGRTNRHHSWAYRAPSRVEGKGWGRKA